MIVTKLIPRGYCHGVVDAIKKIKRLNLETTPKPITILGMLIHNKSVNQFFKAKGIRVLHDPSKTRLELLDKVTDGTVIFTAHGISDLVKQKAIDKGLSIIDTTCFDVQKSFDTISSFIKQGYAVLYVGKKGHPESEAACAIDINVTLIETIEDIKRYPLTHTKLAMTNQTTMSLYDVYSIYEAAKARFNKIELIDEICDATRSRQEAVLNQDKDTDLCIVVGDHLSNNTKKLAEISIQQAHINAIVVETIEDLEIDVLKPLKKVSVTSGASTPTKITNEVIQFLKQFDPLDETTHQLKTALTVQTIL